MKTTLLSIVLFLLFSLGAGAQGLLNNGGKIVIGSGAKVLITGSGGNLRNETNVSNGQVILSGTLIVYGNLTNNVTSEDIFTSPAEGSEVILSGSAAQTLGGSTSAAYVFDKLTITNSTGITLGKGVMVNHELSLGSSLITTGSNVLTIGLTGSITGAGASAYIDGKLARMIGSTGADNIFPIGKGGNYRPLIFNYSALSGTSTVLAEQLESLLPGPAPTNVTFFSGRYWTMSQTGGSDLAFTLSLNSEGFTTGAIKKMIKGDGTTNTDYDVSFSSPNFTNTTPFSSFSNFGIGEYCVGQAVDFAALATKIWGDEPFTVSATGGASGNPVIFTSSNSAVATCTGTNGTTITIIKAGSCTISATQAGNEIYCQGLTNRLLTINPKPIAIAARAGQNKEYGSFDPDPLTYTSSPSLLGSDVFTGLLARIPGEDAGSYAFAIGSLDAGSNYALTVGVAPEFTITPKPLTPEITASSRCYDGTTAATLTGRSLSGIISPDVVTLSTTSSVFENATAGAGKTVFVGGLSLEGADALNYSIASTTTATAEIYSLPIPIITGYATACSGSTGNVFTTETGKSNYIWTVSAGGTITSGGGTTDNTVTVTWNATGGQSVSVIYTGSHGCTAAAATVKNVTVVSLPVPSLTGAATACINHANKVYTTDAGNTNYIWIVSAGGTITSGGTSSDNSVTVTWITAGAQSVSVNYTVGSSCTAENPTVKAVTVVPSPTPTIGGPESICASTSGNVYTTESGMSAYTWIVSAGGTITSGGTATDHTATVTWNTPGDRSVSVNYQNSEGCEGATPAIQNVTVKPLPVPTITGAGAVCGNMTPENYTTETGKSNYVWTLSSGGTITSGSGTAAITIEWSTAGTHTLTVNYTATNGCSAATPTEKTVGVGSLPVVTLSGPATACVTHPAKIYTTESGKFNYSWIVSAGGTVTAGGGTSDHTVTVTWNTAGAQTVSVNYQNAFGCSALSPTVTNVTAIAAPVPTISGPALICSGVSGNIYTTESGMSAYTWIVSAGGTITSGGTTTDHTATVTWNTPGDRSVSVNYQNSEGCEGATPAIQNVTVQQGSVGGSVAGSATVCSGTNSTTLTLSGHTGNVVKWQKSTNNWESSKDVVSETTTLIATNLTSTTKYRAVLQSGACSTANSADAMITVDPVSVGGSVTGVETIVYGSSTETLTLGGHTGTIVKWQKKVGTGEWADIANTLTTSSDTPTSAGTWQYRALVKSGVCSESFSVALSIIVTPKPLPVIGAVAQTKIYDGTIVAGISGATLVGIVGQDDVTLANHTAGTFAQTGIGTDIAVSTAPMTITGAGISNYTLTQPTGLKANITPKELTVTGAVAQSKIYNGTNIAQITGANLIGKIGTEDVTLATHTTGTFAQKNVGTDIEVSTAPMTITGAGIGNYTLVQPTGLKTNITPKPITVTVTSTQSKVYGTADPVFAYTFAPALIGKDTFLGQLSRVPGTNVGIYAVDRGSHSAGTNYVVTYVSAGFTITPKPITVTAVSTTKIYDATALATGTPTFSPALISGDTPSFTQSYDNKMAGTGKLVIPTGKVNDGNGGNNYTVTYAYVVGIIHPLPITGTITAKDKVYDATVAAGILTHSLTGVLLNDEVSYSGGTATFDTPNVGTRKTVIADGLSLTGADAMNYTVNTAAQTTAAISPLAVATLLTVSSEQLQYSDEIILTTTVIGGGQLGDSYPATLSATFTIGGQVMTDGLNNSRIALVRSGNDLIATLTTTLTETSLAGSMAPGVKMVAASFNQINENFLLFPGEAIKSMTITPEDARVTFNGDYLVSVPAGGTTTVALRATVKDNSALPGGDAFAGDISKATVSFFNRTTGALLGTAPVTLLSPSDKKTGTAVFNWTGVPKGEYIIDVIVNKYYTRDAAEFGVVEVYEPDTNYLVGGGYGFVLSNQSNGQTDPESNKRFHFGYGVNFNDNGVISEGRITVLLTRTVNGVNKLYQVQSNGVTAVAVNIDKPALLTGGFIGSAKLTDITDPLIPIELMNSLIFNINMTDRSAPGMKDGISIKLWDGTTLYYSTDQDNEMSLTEGDLIVHSGVNIDNGMVTGTGTTVFDPGATIAAYPNPSPGIVNFKIKVDESSMATLDILSVNGTLACRVYEGYIDSSMGTVINYDSKLPQGIYFYRLKTSTRVLYGKIVIASIY